MSLSQTREDIGELKIEDGLHPNANTSEASDARRLPEIPHREGTQTKSSV